MLPRKPRAVSLTPRNEKLRKVKTPGYQLFPVLDPSQINTAKRFASGPEQEFAPG
jgi:hypothetical protein